MVIVMKRVTLGVWLLTSYISAYLNKVQSKFLITKINKNHLITKEILRDVIRFCSEIHIFDVH